MPVPSAPVHWIGVVVACIVYLFIAGRLVDGIWDTKLVGILYEIVWNLVLRPIVHWLFALCFLVMIGTDLVAAAFTLQSPWESVGWILASIPALRITIWLFWLSDEHADTTRWGRNLRAQQQGIHGWDRFLLWCFRWGEYEGPLTPEEKMSYRSERRKQREIA